MPAGAREPDTVWPPPKFTFSVDIGDGRPIPFSEVSGLEADIKPIEYRHGDSKIFSTLKMPGLRSVANVTLKKGLIPKDSPFWDWLDRARLNVTKRRTVIISLLDEEGAPKMTWTLTNAWPTKASGTDAPSDGDDVAVGTVELACETLKADAL